MISRLSSTLRGVIGICFLVTMLGGINALAQTKTLPKKKKPTATEQAATEKTSKTDVAPSASNNESSVYVQKASNGQPILQFNTSGESKSATDHEGIKFKIPGEGSASDDKMANPIENQKNDAVFKTYIGYPKHQLNLSYAPVSYGAKFSYRGSDFNYSSMDLTGLGVTYTALVTPSVYFDVAASYFSVKSKSGLAGSYTVTDSTSSVLQFNLRGNYCWIGDNFYARLCPGLEIGQDAYPLLAFNSAGRIEMQTANEMTYGVNVFAQYPLLRSSNIGARLGYVMGSGSGQSGGLSSKKNSLIYLDSKVEWPVSPGSLMNVGLYYGLRSSTIEGKTSAVNTDKWDNEIGHLALKIGYTWEFGGN